MAGRASNGESTIYKGADGRWHGYVSVGFKLDGTLDRRHVSSRNRGVVVAKVLRVGRTTVYALMKSGQLRSIHIGRSCRLSRAELERYVDRLESPYSRPQPPPDAA